MFVNFFVNTGRRLLYYFAYGSNLHPVRLQERVPSARLIGTTGLNAHQLAFHKRSDDGSSKCTIYKTNNADDVVYGAIYTLDPEHKSLLDKFEGNGLGYTDISITLNHQWLEYNCFTYRAQASHLVADLKPYHWYKEMVMQGAKYLGFPDAYLEKIRSVNSVEDPDHERKREQAMLLNKMRRLRS